MEEAQAFVRYGKNVSNQKADPPSDDGQMRFPVPKTMASTCTCPPMAIDPNCVIHGEASK
jgi:hypothetical protein